MAEDENLGVSQAIMAAALTSGPLPNKNLPPMLLPFVGKLYEEAKGKEAQGDLFSPSILEEGIRRVAKSNLVVDLIFRRLVHLAQDGSYRDLLQHQPKDIEYAHKIENLIMEKEDSSFDEILSKERDFVFLRQLLEDILDSQESSLSAQKGGISPDLALSALAAAPSCHRRGNADELLAPIPDHWLDK